METNTQDVNFSPRRPQFKLCFAPKCAIGRSYVYVNRPINMIMPMPQKSSDSSTSKSTSKPANLQEYIDKLTVKLPKEVYKRPQTENQVYGWHSIITKKDPLLNHGRKLDPMLGENLMNFAKIRTA